MQLLSIMSARASGGKKETFNMNLNNLLSLTWENIMGDWEKGQYRECKINCYNNLVTQVRKISYTWELWQHVFLLCKYSLRFLKNLSGWQHDVLLEIWLGGSYPCSEVERFLCINQLAGCLFAIWKYYDLLLPN